MQHVVPNNVAMCCVAIVWQGLYLNRLILDHSNHGASKETEEFLPNFGFKNPILDFLKETAP